MTIAVLLAVRTLSIHVVFARGVLVVWQLESTMILGVIGQKIDGCSKACHVINNVQQFVKL
jgi:hypothetical protein